MKKLIVLFFLFVYGLLQIFSQDVVVYKDLNTNYFGLKNSKTGSIIAEAKYKKISNLNDTLYIVPLDSLSNGILNKKGELSKFKNESLYRWEIQCDSAVYDTRNPLRLFASPYYDPRGEMNMSHTFYVNLKDECIPSDYFPCAAWVRINCTSIPEYLKIIQKGEEQLWKNNIDSAIFFGKKAIEIEPNNPSVYYWGANILIGYYDNFQDLSINKNKINASNNSNYSNYYNWVIECLDKAESLETRTYFSLRIQKAKRKFYKQSLKQKDEIKNINEKIEKLKKQCKNYG